MSWNCNSTAGFISGFDSLLQSSDSHVYLSLPWRIDKPIFPPRTTQINFPSTYRNRDGRYIYTKAPFQRCAVHSPATKRRHTIAPHTDRKQSSTEKLERQTKRTGTAARAICHGKRDKHCHSSSRKGLQQDRHVHVKCCLFLLGRSSSVEPYFPSTCG
jgi:hypothetical protein